MLANGELTVARIGWRRQRTDDGRQDDHGSSVTGASLLSRQSNSYRKPPHRAEGRQLTKERWWRRTPRKEKKCFFRIDAAERLASTPTVHRPNSTKKFSCHLCSRWKKTYKNSELEMREYTKAQRQHDEGKKSWYGETSAILLCERQNQARMWISEDPSRTLRPSVSFIQHAGHFVLPFRRWSKHEFNFKTWQVF